MESLDQASLFSVDFVVLPSVFQYLTFALHCSFRSFSFFQKRPDLMIQRYKVVFVFRQNKSIFSKDCLIVMGTIVDKDLLTFSIGRQCFDFKTLGLRIEPTCDLSLKKD